MTRTLTPPAPVSRAEFDATFYAVKNWGRWGPDDEVGALNFLTQAEVLRGVQSVKQGKVFTLGTLVGGPSGDPVWPGRAGATKLMTQDEGHYLSGKLKPVSGGLEYADDYASPSGRSPCSTTSASIRSSTSPR